jgi:lipoate-protein ligase A
MSPLVDLGTWRLMLPFWKTLQKTTHLRFDSIAGKNQRCLLVTFNQSLTERYMKRAAKSILSEEQTGGGAIVHDHELTYSIIIPQTNRSHGADSPLYQSVHQAIISALQTVGISATRFGNASTHTGSHEPFLCFQRRTREDLVVSGYKVLGSAQRRGGLGILQHGSLLLASSAAAPELPGLWNLTAPARRRTRNLVEVKS